MPHCNAQDKAPSSLHSLQPLYPRIDFTIASLIALAVFLSQEWALVSEAAMA
jgi:hypothetical protein